MKVLDFACGSAQDLNERTHFFHAPMNDTVLQPLAGGWWPGAVLAFLHDSRKQNLHQCLVDAAHRHLKAVNLTMSFSRVAP